MFGISLIVAIILGYLLKGKFTDKRYLAYSDRFLVRKRAKSFIKDRLDGARNSYLPIRFIDVHTDTYIYLEK